MPSSSPTRRPTRWAICRAILQRDAFDGNEGANVGGAHARMRAVVLPHVDHLRRLGDGLERRLGHGVRRADEGDDRAIRVGPGIDVQQLHARDGFNRVGDGLDLGPVASFGEVGDTFDDLGWHLELNSLVVQASRLQRGSCRRDACTTRVASTKQGGLGKALAFPPHCGDTGGFRLSRV